MMTEKLLRSICNLTSLFFTSLIKPLLWKFPVIYYLENESYEFLNSPVPIIIGVDSKMADYKLRINMKEISNNLVTYFIKEDIVEKEDIKIMQPTFNNRIDNLQKRYIRLQKYLANPSQIAFKSKNTLFVSYLSKCRQLIDDTLIYPVLKNEVFRQSMDTVISTVISENKKEARFFELVCDTQMFTSFVHTLQDLSEGTDLTKSVFYT